MSTLLSCFLLSPLCIKFNFQAVQDSAQHSVSYTLSRNKAIIVEYNQDNDTDMFQIGRSSEGPIDFVVMDTIPGFQRNARDNVTQSTISRFACRIIVDRNPPYTARIFAAGFDSARNIFLGVGACLRCLSNSILNDCSRTFLIL